MKKIISYILLVALVFNVFAMNVFAADAPITAEITGAASTNETENKGDVNIKITSTAGKDLLIKVIDVADPIFFLCPHFFQFRQNVWFIGHKL